MQRNAQLSLYRGDQPVHDPIATAQLGGKQRSGLLVFVERGTGPFLGPPTGRPVHFTVIDVATVRDGRIVEHWGVPDRLAVLLQIGALQPPVPRAALAAG